MCRAAEAAVGQQGHRLTHPLAHDRTRHAQHLAHARAAFRALVANDDHVSRPYLLAGDRSHCIFFGFKHPRRPAMLQPFMAADLGHASLGREIALEDHQSSGCLQRPAQRSDDLLPCSLNRIRSLGGNCAPGNSSGGGMQQVSIHQSFGQQPNPARAVHVGGNETARWL